MNYGAILASGRGTRMKNTYSIPKQFVEIEGIPTIIYTIKNMLKINRFDYIYIAVPEEYLEYMNKLINKYINKENINKLIVVSGGKERMDSIDNIINKIKKDREIKENDIIVIHDGVRPFVTEKILNDSIDSAREHGAVVAAIPVSDTLLISNEGEIVDEIPKRSLYYKGQAPDSFKLKLFIDLLNKLDDNQRKEITGTSQVCTLNNYPIHMIEGDEVNFKITTASDFVIAKNIIKGGEKND